MNPYDPNLPLISVHIPKCAGSSFSDVLEAWFGRNFLRHYHDEKRNRPPRKHKLHAGIFRKKPRRDVCIHGHFNNDRGNGVQDYYPGVRQVITVLRNPFDLHLSNYFYVRREAVSTRGAHRSGGTHPIIENRWNLQDYLANCRQSYIRSFLPPEITEENHERVLAEQFLYIGISERLQHTVDTLANLLGYPTVSVPQKNVSEWSEEIPPGAREVFEENNRLEMLIYWFARRHWGA